MSLQLLYHPLASYCWKVLIALYELEAPFEAKVVDLSDSRQGEELKSFWPVGKFPVLRDFGRDQVIPESSIIVEYLDQHYARARPLIPRDPAAALQTRLWERFFDCYIHTPLQKIVGNSLRAEGQHDLHGVTEARALLHTAYAMLDKHLGATGWAAGPEFGMADCAAVPALFYAGTLESFVERYPRVNAYFERLAARASVVRTIKEAQPHFPLYPYRASIPARFL